jgi:hypothetical protein
VKFRYRTSIYSMELHLPWFNQIQWQIWSNFERSRHACFGENTIKNRPCSHTIQN